MAEGLYTIKEIAQQLDLPESTLRKYRDAYIDYIPFVGSGRNKKYESEAVGVFRLIRECREERRLSWEDTEEEIGKGYSMNSQAQRAEKRAVIEAEDAVNLVDRLEEILKQLKKGSERQEFMMTALASELMRFSGTLDKVKDMAKDVSEFRQLIFKYNESMQMQYKLGMRHTETVAGRLAAIEEGIEYLPGHIDQRFEEAAARAEEEREREREREERMKPPLEVSRPEPAAEAGPVVSPDGDRVTIDPVELTRIREEMLKSRIECGKYKNLYERVKKDFDEFKRSQEEKAVLDGQLSEPVGERLEKMLLPGPQGGKLTVRGRKK